ncbi:MAG TPA: hypothetical protein VIC33_16520 [Vicinamibacterales bacterium]
MTAGHFVFIPAVLVVGMVIGWILGSRAAADAYAAELKRREERAVKVREREREQTAQHAPASSVPGRDASPAPPEVRR